MRGYRGSPLVSNSMIVNKCEDTGGGGLSLNNSINSAGHVYYIYVMVTNASCAIVIEDQADQVGSANDFTCNGVPKKRKASAITDFFSKRPTGTLRSPSVVI